MFRPSTTFFPGQKEKGWWRFEIILSVLGPVGLPASRPTKCIQQAELPTLQPGVLGMLIEDIRGQKQTRMSRSVKSSRCFASHPSSVFYT